MSNYDERQRDIHGTAMMIGNAGYAVLLVLLVLVREPLSQYLAFETQLYLCLLLPILAEWTYMILNNAVDGLDGKPGKLHAVSLAVFAVAAAVAAFRTISGLGQLGDFQGGLPDELVQMLIRRLTVLLCTGLPVVLYAIRKHMNRKEDESVV